MSSSSGVRKGKFHNAHVRLNYTTINPRVRRVVSRLPSQLREGFFELKILQLYVENLILIHVSNRIVNNQKSTHSTA